MAEEPEKSEHTEQKVVPSPRGSLNTLPRFEQELERFFGRPWGFAWPSRKDWPLSTEFGRDAPSVDVIEREGEIVVKAELPGFKKEDIDVSLTEDRITIKASTESETETKEDGEYHRKEIRRGYVARTVPLPAGVVSDKAKARLTDGVLEVTVPKAQMSKRQSVEIES